MSTDTDAATGDGRSGSPAADSKPYYVVPNVELADFRYRLLRFLVEQGAFESAGWRCRRAAMDWKLDEFRQEIPSYWPALGVLHDEGPCWEELFRLRRDAP